MRLPVALVLLIASAACSGKSQPKRPPVADQRAAASAAVESVTNGAFEPARRQASAVLAKEPQNASAAAARALSSYVLALSALRSETEAVLESAGERRGFDHPKMRAALEATLGALGEVSADLDVAAAEPGFELELCLACWERDWNHSGEIDEGDRRFLQLEIDADGREFPEGDPRRRPTFRFDVGDVHWARAMVSFQSALLELVLAYRWTELDKLLAAGNVPPRIRIEIDRPERVRRARDHILVGLDAAASCRAAYLAETDDDREWVPNPKQASHPLPLPVDDALYRTWAGVIDDLRGLVSGKTGLSVAELAQLGDSQWADPPGGYLDIGAMLDSPKTIVLDFASIIGRLEEADGGRPKAAAIEGLLADVFGDYYKTSMKPSPIVGRLSRMKSELERDEDTFERKLRYLLWLN